MTTATEPNPGSQEAIDAGCSCPILDNSHGRGYMGVEGIFVYVKDCPVHEWKEEENA